MAQDWINGLLGGALIGTAVSMMLLLNGRVTGISGILNGVLSAPSPKEDRKWRGLFLLGLVAGGFTLKVIMPSAFNGTLETPDWTVAVAGLLVGFGTLLGSGCTSGHGVCGISRMSPRSLVATVVFISFGVAAVAGLKAVGVVP